MQFLDVNVRLLPILHFIPTVDLTLNAPNRYVIAHDNEVLGYIYTEWVYISPRYLLCISHSFP